MAFLTRSCVLRLQEACVVGPIYTQLRWRKPFKRKPRWLPMAASKVFRIPVHPYVPPDEEALVKDLLDEFIIKMFSMRALFKEELAQKAKDEGNTMENQQEEQEKFRMLLEENKKENERVRIIREEMMEKLFQEKQLELMQLEEVKKAEQKETKNRVEKIVREEKEKYLSFVTYENLEEIIEKALDDPINVNFTIDLNGGIKWEGKPSVEFEEKVMKQIQQSMEH